MYAVPEGPKPTETNSLGCPSGPGLNPNPSPHNLLRAAILLAILITAATPILVLTAILIAAHHLAHSSLLAWFVVQMNAFPTYAHIRTASDSYFFTSCNFYAQTQKIARCEECAAGLQACSHFQKAAFI
eukprot:1160858-Pelagomonas_calceolata.AAC.11